MLGATRLGRTAEFTLVRRKGSAVFSNLGLSGGWPVAGVIVVGVLLAIVWVIQFANLMALNDGDFPGQFVRFGWVAGFVLLWPLAPFAFMLWSRRRPGRRTRHRRERNGAD